MLFWMIRSLWEVFGTDLWAARLIPFAAMAGLLFMTLRLSREILPNKNTTAMFLLASLPVWLIYGSVIMFDTLLGVCTVCAMLVLWRLSQGASFKYWLIYGTLLGIGILTKGPVALVYMLPAALLAKAWLPVPVSGWWKGVALSVLMGATIALAWAIPAAVQGGDEYTQKIFVTQSAGRMVNAFDHREPFWFYTPVLIGFLLPVLLWPQIWRGARTTLCASENKQIVRFIACWIVPVFVFFSAINSKQIHYMIPILPGFAILAALALQGAHVKIARLLCAGSFVLVIMVHAVLGTILLRTYDLTPLKAGIDPYRARPMAAAPKYDGEYGYMLKMDKEIVSIGRETNDVNTWFAANPNGIIILRHKKPEDVNAYNVLFTRPFRRDEILSIVEQKR
jgi:4-amino-4-deoxy-L-arabinose transferase-like glycosyltransferase